MTTSEIDEIRPGARDRAVFAADGEVFSWADVVAAARLRGSWRELHAATRHGLACERRLAASGGEIDQKEFIEASTHFRYARNLLSGDDLTAWLEAWSVTGPEWRNHVRHALLRERWAGELEETASRFPVPGAEVTGATWPEAACSGFVYALVVAQQFIASGAIKLSMQYA